MADLLEYLSGALHCSYLSDLHYITATSRQVEELLTPVESRFSLEDYQQALDYLRRGHGDRPQDLSSARQALADVLMARK